MAGQLNGMKVPLTWGVVVTAGAGLFTYLGAVYATKAELTAHTSSAMENTSRMETRAALLESSSRHHDEAIKEMRGDVKSVLKMMEAANQNITTLMTANDIPRSKIARPRDDP